VTPATVRGGAAATGTVTLHGAAPAGGVSVPLTSSPAAAGVPATVDVPGGAMRATVAITTKPVAKNTHVSIGTSYGGVSKAPPLLVSRP